LENGVRGEQMVSYQLQDLLLIDGGGFEHGCEGEDSWRRK
jgi:hypothetical protein